MTLFEQLQKKLAESGSLTLEDFRRWFAPVLRDVHKSGDADAEKLAHAVEWEFCDLGRGLTSEEALRENLLRLASADTALAVANPPQPKNSDVEVVRQQVELQPKARALVAVAGNGGGCSTSMTLVVVQSAPRNEESSSSFTLSGLEATTPA